MAVRIRGLESVLILALGVAVGALAARSPRGSDIAPPDRQAQWARVHQARGRADEARRNWQRGQNWEDGVRLAKVLIALQAAEWAARTDQGDFQPLGTPPVLSPELASLFGSLRAMAVSRAQRWQLQSLSEAALTSPPSAG